VSGFFLPSYFFYAQHLHLYFFNYPYLEP